MLTKPILVLLMVMFSVVGAPLCSNAHGATLAISEVEKTDLTFMREEEKLARDTYLTFYALYDFTIFSNIASAEQMHMNALLNLLKKYNVPDPAAGNEIGEFTNTDLQALYNTLVATGQQGGLAALNVGGLIEEKDMIDLKRAIADSQKIDIDATYTTLMCGSRNHLRGFAKNIEAVTGTTYVAQLLTQAEVDAILQSPMERCGGNGNAGSFGTTSSQDTTHGKGLGWMR